MMREAMLFDTPELAVLTSDPTAARKVDQRVKNGEIGVTRGAVSPDWIADVVAYLSTIGRSSIPNWQPLSAGAPNFHRISVADPRSHVSATFHQFNFFPWNQDCFQFFSALRPVFEARNIMLGEAADSFLGSTPDRGASARVGFQYYPVGGGFMNTHVDPAGFHQSVLVSLVMSRAGTDYREGGVYVEDANGTRFFAEEHCSPGDLLWFDPQVPHGVAPIDPDAPLHWTRFQGRWMGLFATNKVEESAAIGDAVDTVSP
ncbi:MAG: hypothetical protein ABGX91_08200 [Thermoleophilia bacterium]